MNKISEHAINVLEYDSLLNLLSDYAKTAFAKKEILSMYPLSDASLIKNQIAETSELADLISIGETLPLGALDDILPFITNQKMVGAELEPEQLLSVAAVLQSCADVYNFAKMNKETAARLWAAASEISPHAEIISEINRCIDPTEKNVKDNASIKLKELRRAKANLQSSIKKKLTSLINSSESC
jgi:DNA mismatch repair protein MutS2